MNKLERLRDRGCITLVYSDAAHTEAAFNDARREAKAAEFAYTTLNSEPGDNSEVKQAIENIPFPDGARTQNKKNDVLAVYHAELLGWPLITMDGNSKSQPGGILGRATALSHLGIEVMTPQEALARVIRVRAEQLARG